MPMRKTLFHEADQVAIIDCMDVTISNPVALRHPMDLRPLRKGVAPRIKENIRDESRKAAVSVQKRMYISKSML